MTWGKRKLTPVRLTHCLLTTCHTGRQKRRHPVSVHVNPGSGAEEELHDVQTATLSAVVQSSVALHRLSVDVSSNLYQVLGDLVVALVAGDHEAGVAVSVGHLNVSIVLHQILDNLVMSVKAGSSQRRRVSLSCAVHIGSTLAEKLDYV